MFHMSVNIHAHHQHHPYNYPHHPHFPTIMISLWYIYIYIYTHVFLFLGKAYIHLFRPLLVHPLQISQKKHPTHLRVTASSQGSDGIWPTALAAARAGPALSMLSFNELVAACERMVPSKNGGQGG